MVNTPPNNELDAKSFKRLQAIHWFFCILMLVFIAIIIGLNKFVGGNAINNHNDNSLLYVSFLATVLFPVISNFIFYKRLEEIDLDEPVRFRFGKFLSANVVRYLWLAGAGLIDMFVWFLTSTLLISLFTIFLLLVLIIIRPIKWKVIRTLRMKPVGSIDKPKGARQ